MGSLIELVWRGVIAEFRYAESAACWHCQVRRQHPSRCPRFIERVGGSESIPVDVRVLAATHRNLELAIEESDFRQDLFFRLNVALISLPPLRERREDIPELVKYFIERYG